MEGMTDSKMSPILVAIASWSSMGAAGTAGSEWASDAANNTKAGGEAAASDAKANGEVAAKEAKANGEMAAKDAKASGEVTANGAASATSAVGKSAANTAGDAAANADSKANTVAGGARELNVTGGAAGAASGTANGVHNTAASGVADAGPLLAATRPGPEEVAAWLAELPAWGAPLADLGAESHATWEVRLFAS